jgi:RNA polymerase sigma-70 factor, ECF subfamily
MKKQARESGFRVVDNIEALSEEDFIRELMAVQAPVYGYIRTLVVERTAAHDILQEVNITAWRKNDGFKPGTSFLAWACKIAYFHVLNYRRNRRREKLIFDDDVVSYLAERRSERDEEISDRRLLMRECLNQLPSEARRLLEERYGPGASVAGLAKSEGLAPATISLKLFRIREVLLDCIQKKLPKEGLA